MICIKNNMSQTLSNRPKVRRSELTSESPGLALVYSAFPGHNRARELELRTHEILAIHRIRREWFSVDGRTAVSAITQAATELGLILTSFEDDSPTLLIRLEPTTKAELRKAARAERGSMAIMAGLLINEGLQRRAPEPKKKPRA
jgi:hypothetical protein